MAVLVLVRSTSSVGVSGSSWLCSAITSGIRPFLWVSRTAVGVAHCCYYKF